MFFSRSGNTLIITPDTTSFLYGMHFLEICNATYLFFRFTAFGVQTAFSSRPRPDSHYLEWGHDMFCLGVRQGDALLFDGSTPHGNWFNGTDEDCYSAFFTLHPTSHPGFEKGFPNTTTAQCYNIWEGLGGPVGKGSSSADWPLASRQVFNEHPALLRQVHYYYL